MMSCSRQSVEDLRGLAPHLVEQRLGLAEAARDQLGRARPTRAVRADRGDDDQDAVLREVPPVAERDVAARPPLRARRRT